MDGELREKGLLTEETDAWRRLESGKDVDEEKY